jgi:SAM-dependent methyltransferase
MSSEEQRAHWDLKYEEGLSSLKEPDPFFLSAYERFVDPLFPNAGGALDLAGGLGRHALWLAQRRWQVCVVDISSLAIAKLGFAARELNVKVDLFVKDAAEYKFEPEQFDLILLFYHLDRSLFPKIVASLNPGGLLICKMGVRWNSDGHTPAPADPLHREELPTLIPKLHVLHHQERPVRNRGVAEFIGKK